MGFDLLTVPQVALRQILGGLTSTELFELTQCSKYTMEKIKPFEKANKSFKTGVDFQRKWVEIRGVRRFVAKGNKEDDNIRTTDLQTRFFEGKEFQCEQEDEQNINVFCPEADEDETLKLVTTHFKETLGLGRLESLFVDEHTPLDKVLEWINNDKFTFVDNFNFSGCPEDQADAYSQLIYSTEFMDKVKANFTSLVNPTEGFVPNGFKPDEVISMVKFQVDHSHWMTLQHLKCFNATALILYQSRLSNEDINAYLKLVSDLHYNRLYFLSITRENGVWNLAQIIEGLADANSISNENNEQSIVFPRADGKQFEIEVQENGTKLSITIDQP